MIWTQVCRPLQDLGAMGRAKLEFGGQMVPRLVHSHWRGCIGILLLTKKPPSHHDIPSTTSLHYPNLSSCYHIHPKHNTCTHLLNTKRNKVCPPHQKQTPRDSVQANQLIKFHMFTQDQTSHVSSTFRCMSCINYIHNINYCIV